MCGLTGAVWTDSRLAISEPVLERMTERLTHRGPDAAGTHHEPLLNGGGVRLGHRRLSVIDLSDAGRQPLGNEDGSIQIVFNGEIYNHAELRADLIARGHRFATATDTETIVHLYEERDVDCVTDLRGMFAFALWDQSRQRLFLARDRMGQKPLFYREESGRLIFASELKSLLAISDVPKRIDPTALDDYLHYLYVPHPRCILDGFRKLPPAHRAVYEAGQLTVERYWSEPDEIDETTTEADWRENLRETLTEAVRLRLRSDVPLGTFLSGGLDSSIITGLTASLVDRRVQTFSIGFPEADFDERSFARLVSERLGTEHHERVVDPSAIDELPKLVWHYDEPFADSSAIPTLALSRMTRERVTVALSGDAGDELFGGYRRYRAVQLASRFDRLPGPLRRLIGSRFWRHLPASSKPNTVMRKIKRFQAAIARDPQRRYLSWVSFLESDARDELYHESFRQRLADHDPERWILNAYGECGEADLLTRTMCVDRRTYLPGDILTKVDVASMSVGLECRSPFLDHRVVELAARMPTRFKLNRGEGKWILGETFSDLVPSSIRSRRKMGFGVPLAYWFRTELKDLLTTILLGDRMRSRNLFRPDAVRRTIEEHLAGRADHSYRLWSLLVLELWQRTWLDGDGSVIDLRESV